MRSSFILAVPVLVLSSGGCGTEPRHLPAAGKSPATANEPARSVGTATATGSRPQGQAFLDDKRGVEPHVEWNREVSSRTGGTIAFRVSSTGPFAVTVITGQAYKALQSGDQNPISQSDILLTVDAKGPTYEGRVTVRAGSSYFIMENKGDKAVDLHLECFEAK